MKELLERDDIRIEVAENVNDSILALETHIEKLQKRLQKIRITPEQDSRRGRIKAQLHRALYPFKESTLAKLREITGEAKEDLNVALHALQMYVRRKIKPVRQIDSFQRRLSNQSDSSLIFLALTPCAEIHQRLHWTSLIFSQTI